MDDGRGDGEAPLLTTGEVPGIGVGEMGQTEGREDLVGASLTHLRVQAQRPRRRQHVVADGATDEGRRCSLRHPGDDPGEVGGGPLVRRR